MIGLYLYKNEGPACNPLIQFSFPGLEMVRIYRAAQLITQVLQDTLY